MTLSPQEKTVETAATEMPRVQNAMGMESEADDMCECASTKRCLLVSVQMEKEHGGLSHPAHALVTCTLLLLFEGLALQTISGSASH